MTTLEMGTLEMDTYGSSGVLSPSSRVKCADMSGNEKGIKFGSVYPVFIRN